jgi:lactoylglutathione lyase
LTIDNGKWKTENEYDHSLIHSFTQSIIPGNLFQHNFFNMTIDHVAIWTCDLDRLRDFYTGFFQAVSCERYINPRTGFESYFLAFGHGARLELMYRPDLEETNPAATGSPPVQGIAHLAFSAASTNEVDRKTNELQSAGFRPVDGPRYTGDGYYEVTIADPDGNLVEISCRVAHSDATKTP